jgi:hypothetical protein
LLGGFDGRDRRELHVYAVDPGPEQMLVSMHEQLHHELHWSTLWGLTAAMAGLLAEEGVDTDRLNDVATVMNASCRQVHEVFATTISSGVIGLEAAGRLLRGNERYLSYLAQGLVGMDDRGTLCLLRAGTAVLPVDRS